MSMSRNKKGVNELISYEHHFGYERYKKNKTGLLIQ